MPTLGDPDICPKCECSALEEGEAQEGTTAAYKWQYCTACPWQSDVERYRLVKTSYGVEYCPDATFVRPDVALALRLRGRVQLGLDTEDECESIPRSRSHPTASCPRCGEKIELRFQLGRDITTYEALWECDDCGFQARSGTCLSPGTFLPSWDYRELIWRGEHYLLTDNQQVFIEQLYKAYVERRADVHQDVLLKKIGQPNSRLKDSFQHANGELFGTLIIHFPSAPRGTYRLNL